MIHKNISIIVAIAENNAIGKDNKLLWHLSTDLQRFKQFTTGKTMIMGKKTFLSLPVRPLPNRRSIVISDDPADDFKGCEMAHSIEEAIQLAGTDQEAFIIGGGMVYRQFLPLAGRLYLTTVKHSFEADTFFPEIDFGQWRLVQEEAVPADEKNQYASIFQLFER